jgi:hypothetical protein
MVTGLPSLCWYDLEVFGLTLRFMICSLHADALVITDAAFAFSGADCAQARDGCPQIAAECLFGAGVAAAVVLTPGAVVW